MPSQVPADATLESSSATWVPEGAVSSRRWTGDGFGPAATLAPPSAVPDVAFPLYAAARTAVADFQTALRRVRLTYPQFLVMLLLWQHGHQTVSEIRARLGLDSGTLSPLLQRLDTAGLVDRNRCMTDRRVLHVSPTAAGQQLRQAALVAVAEVTARWHGQPDTTEQPRRRLAELTLACDQAPATEPHCDGVAVRPAVWMPLVSASSSANPADLPADVTATEGESARRLLRTRLRQRPAGR